MVTSLDSRIEICRPTALLLSGHGILSISLKIVMGTPDSFHLKMRNETSLPWQQPRLVRSLWVRLQLAHSTGRLVLERFSGEFLSNNRLRRAVSGISVFASP